jgi:hypothetical protein
MSLHNLAPTGPTAIMLEYQGDSQSAPLGLCFIMKRKKGRNSGNEGKIGNLILFQFETENCRGGWRAAISL